ncbi:uncharacterized protein METZ01_LOCUS340306 [marine metagenome]|uniref:Lipocalin/cytosolic fatty-acid binding domain-containing protein n=1 Tax=marine metagenome TaxID=408172 RepID=A0A382QRK0_9ZZZZ
MEEDETPWVLSRKPTMDEFKYSKLVESLAKRNFDIRLLKVTPQT